MTIERKSDYFCTAPWQHLCIRPGSSLFPCCQFSDWQDPPILEKGDLNDLFNHDSFKNLRRKLLDGNKLLGCQKCYDQDKSGHPSLRKHMNQYQLNENTIEAKVKNVKTMELFLGDVCNLKCIMCHPNLSSTWREDFEKLGKKMNPRYHYNSEIEKIMGSLHSLKELKFVGGEPLLAQGKESILQAIHPNMRKNISLDYNTNVTIKPSSELISLWQQFREVTIWLSIDGIGKINEFVRYPTKWETVEENTKFFIALEKQIPQFNLKLIYTANVYNIEFSLELEEWMLDIGVKQLVFNPVIDPAFLSPANLPKDYRNKVIKKLENSSDKMSRIADYLRLTNLEFDENVIKYTKKMCQVRNINVEDYLGHLDFLL